MTMPDPKDEQSLLLPLSLPAEFDQTSLVPRMQRWIWAFVILGIVARTVRYVMRFPLWEDECYVCVNFFHRGYLDLLKPLEYHQVGPFLWLWLEKTAVLLFGFNELSLRLFAFVGSILSLLLFYHLVSRVIAGPARLIGIAFFAVGYPCLRYAAEAKLYPYDLFTSLVLMVLWVEWLHRPDRRRWLWALVVWCPLAIGLSYAAVFTAIGIGILFLWTIIHHRIRGGWTAWMAYNAALALGAGLVYLLTLRNQMGAELGFQSEAYTYAQAFPPLTSIGAFLKWMVLAHTGSLFAHPVGGEHWGSMLTTLLCLVAIVVFIRRKRAMVSMLLCVPMGVHLLVAIMKRYPYATHFKFSMYVAPIIYILFGVGCTVLLAHGLTKDKIPSFRRHTGVVLVVAAVLGLGSIYRDVFHPYKCKSNQRARGFAMWFWPTATMAGDVYCLRDDLGLEFAPDTWSDLSWSSMYLCNKYIYQPLSHTDLPTLEGTGAPFPQSRTIRYVLYRDLRHKFDQPAFDQWLAQTKQQYTFVKKETYPFAWLDKRDRHILTADVIEVYEFKTGILE